MSYFSLPMVDRHGLSPQRHTCQQECLQTEERTNCQYFSQRSLLGCHVVESVPELSFSAWNCRTEEPPPIVISCAQSSSGFSNTRRTRRALNGLLRGCLMGEKTAAGLCLNITPSCRPHLLPVSKITSSLLYSARFLLSAI